MLTKQILSSTKRLQRFIFRRLEISDLSNSIMNMLANKELERSLIPNLWKTKFWRRYIDDAICFVKIGSIEYIRSVLNSFHKNIQFTYEVESEAKLPSLDMLLMRNQILQQQYIEKRVIQMFIYTGNCYANIMGERDTENSSWERISHLLNPKTLLEKELTHIRTAFKNTNGYPY